MSDERPSEGAPGWALLGCGLLVGLVLPVWLLVTIAVMQLSPALNGLDAEGASAPGLLAWLEGAWVAGRWMVFALPAFIAVLAGFSVAAFVARRRALADRERLDAIVASDAVLDSPGWSPAPENDGAPAEGG